MPISPAAISSPTATRVTPYSCGPTSETRPNGGFISGKYNEVIYIVGSANPATWQQQKEFAAVVTADNARAFGRDLAGALRNYLENSDK